MKETLNTGGWWRERNDIFDAGLSSHALLVRFYLARCSDRQGRSYPGINTIAEKCRIGRSTVKRALTELQERGFLFVESGRTSGSSNQYILNISVTDSSMVPHPVKGGGPHRTRGWFSLNRGVVHTGPQKKTYLIRHINKKKRIRE